MRPMTTRVAPKLGCHRKLLLRVAGVIAVSLPVANFSQSLAQSAPAGNPAAMAADTNPEFEVATIKPAKPGGPVQGITINGRQFLVYDTALLNLIGFAYGVQREEIVGAPEWASSEKYDVSAEQSAEGQPTLQQWKTMVQKLLADRFELKFHREKRELTVYALVLGKDGPKLTKSSSQSSLPNVSFHPSGEFRAQNETMENFAGQLQGTVLGRPVVDQTGFEEGLISHCSGRPMKHNSRRSAGTGHRRRRALMRRRSFRRDPGAIGFEDGVEEGFRRRAGDRSRRAAVGELAASLLAKADLSTTAARSRRLRSR